jgi:hypothetical protein
MKEPLKAGTRTSKYNTADVSEPLSRTSSGTSALQIFIRLFSTSTCASAEKEQSQDERNEREGWGHRSDCASAKGGSQAGCHASGLTIRFVIALIRLLL